MFSQVIHKSLPYTGTQARVHAQTHMLQHMFMHALKTALEKAMALLATEVESKCKHNVKNWDLKSKDNGMRTTELAASAHHAFSL